MVRKYRLLTLGCKVNQYESQQIRQLIESFGFVPGADGEKLDLAVVNTCAVTAEAGRKNRQAIRRLARLGGAPVIVVGCGASAEAERFKKLHGVAAVLGHDSDVHAEIGKILNDCKGGVLPGVIQKRGPHAQITGKRRELVGNELSMNPDGATPIGSFALPRTPPPPHAILPRPLPVVKTPAVEIGRIDRFDGHQRAFLKVQDGCDAFCSYCIIPRLRPVLRSKSIEVAVAEARTLVAAGHREIILTGIFLGAFGRKTAIRKRFQFLKSPLAKLVRSIARVDGLKRLRLSSLEPGDVDHALLEVLATEPTCVAHLHLPLQSGSPDVLRRMNRQYSRDQFIDMVDRVRLALDQPAISTDILVGFPGETDEDFAQTLAVAKQSEFCKIHAFPFSPREKTSAAKWRDQFVSPTVVRQRLAQLRILGQESSLSFRRRFLGRTERVIVERNRSRDESDRSGCRIFHGRADRYFDVHFEAPTTVRPGDLLPVRIDRVTPTRTHATVMLDARDSYPLPVLSDTMDGTGAP